MDIAVSNTKDIVNELEGLTPELITEVIDFIEFPRIKKMKNTGINYSS
jgi:hypothetical protein